MKKLLCAKLCFVGLLLCPFFLAAQTGYNLKLELTGCNDSTLFRLLDLDAGNIVDSAYLQNGKLTFKGVVAKPAVFRIHTKDNYIIVYLENKLITIKGSYKDFYYSKIEGTENSRQWTKSRDAQKSMSMERDSLTTLYFSSKPPVTGVVKRVMRERIGVLDSLMLNYRIAFIRSEKPTYFTVLELFMLRNKLNSDSLRSLFALFPKELCDSKEGIVISNHINSEKPVIGSHFIDVKGLDVDGIGKKLSEQKGKYILLDFWASWCGPCREENPNLMQAYNLYKGKGFEIFSVSVDTNKADWLSAVKADKLSWINVIDQNGFYGAGVASYRIMGIPDNFLIDPNGIIIAKNLRGEKLMERLKTIYKE